MVLLSHLLFRWAMQSHGVHVLELAISSLCNWIQDLATEMKNRGNTPVVALGGNGVLRQKLEDAGIKTYPISK
jgi:hypothetical protein